MRTERLGMVLGMIEYRDDESFSPEDLSKILQSAFSRLPRTEMKRQIFILKQVLEQREANMVVHHA